MFQLPYGLPHGVAADAEAFGKLPFRRELFPEGKAAVFNFLF